MKANYNQLHHNYSYYLLCVGEAVFNVCVSELKQSIERARKRGNLNECADLYMKLGERRINRCKFS